MLKRGQRWEQMSHRVLVHSVSHPGAPGTLINHTSPGQEPSGCPTVQGGTMLGIHSQSAGGAFSLQTGCRNGVGFGPLSLYSVTQQVSLESPPGTERGPPKI